MDHAIDSTMEECLKMADNLAKQARAAALAGDTIQATELRRQLDKLYEQLEATTPQPGFPALGTSGGPAVES